MIKTLISDLYRPVKTVDTQTTIENVLYDIAVSIYNAYKERFIQKQYRTTPKEQFQVVKTCHEWHKMDRKQNRVSLEKVIEVLNTQSPSNLNHMIKEEQNKKQQQSGTPMAYRESQPITPLLPRPKIV